jgi:hypothetical protein
VSAQQMPLPPFRKIEGKNLCVEHEAQIFVARAFGLPPPPPSPEVKLITAAEFAEMLRCSIHHMRKRIARQARQARQAATAEAPDRDQAA